MTIIRGLASALIFSVLSFLSGLANAQVQPIYQSVLLSLGGSAKPVLSHATIWSAINRAVVAAGAPAEPALLEDLPKYEVTCTINNKERVKGTVFAVSTQFTGQTAWQWAPDFIADSVTEMHLLQPDKWSTEDSPYLYGNCLGGKCYNLYAVELGKVKGVTCDWYAPFSTFVSRPGKPLL